MNIDQTPTAATNPSTTEDPKQQNNDNSNPQQGPGIVRRSASVATASHPHSDSASFTTVKKKDTRKLFVGGLPSDVTGEEFRNFFQQFGAISDSVIMFDRETRRSRGFGFVTFEDPESSARVLSMGNAQHVQQQQQDSNTNNDPPVARLEMRGKKIEAKAAEPKESSQRRYNEHHGHSRGRPPFPSLMNANMMMMYGPNDPNLYYNYNALGQYYAPHQYTPPPFVGYMAPMYYPEQVPQYYPPSMPMVEGYPQYPPMDAAYGYASFPAAMPPIYEQPMAPDIPVKEEGVEVEGSTAVTP